LTKEINFKLEAVEIIGGATRIPSLQKAIQEVFGIECSRTLNATECISRGAAIQVKFSFNPDQSH
jgi:heat shock protein 4